MMTVDSVASLFERDNPGYWMVHAGNVKKGNTSDSIKDVRDPVQQHADFAALCNLLPDGNYTVSLQTGVSASTSKTVHPFRIGEAKRVSGVGDNGNGQNSPRTGNNDSMWMQMMTLMMQMQTQNHQTVLAQMDKQMDLSVKLAEAKNQAEIQKIDGNKTVMDKIFKIGEMHLPAILGTIYKTPVAQTAVAGVGRAKSETGQTVPVEKDTKSEPSTDESKKQAAMETGLRVKNLLDRVYKLNPEDHPITTLEVCTGYFEGNPGMLVAFLGEWRKSKLENAKNTNP